MISKTHDFLKSIMELFEHPEFSFDDFIRVYKFKDFEKLKVVNVKNKRWSNYITIFDNNEFIKILSCKKKRRNSTPDIEYLKDVDVVKSNLSYGMISSLYNLDEKI